MRDCTAATIAGVVLLLLLLGRQAKAEPADALKPAGTIPLEGRIDHMALDAKGRRLFVAALGNDTVEVIDLKTGKQSGRIGGMKKPQGLAYLADLNRLVVASGDDGKVRVYDAHQKLLGTVVDGLDDADNVRYDPAAKLAYVGYGDGALAIIDPEKVQKVGEIKLDGHPESFQLETKGGRVFVNVPDAKHVAVVDREKRAVVPTWPVGRAAANFPMALDEEHHRLFVGCRRPATLIVLDTGTGRTVANVGCAGDTDDVFYDAASRRVYIAGGEGVVSVFEQTDADQYRPLGRVATTAGARTAFFAPDVRTLYVAVPRRGPHSAELRTFAAPGSRPQ
jgi:DNA-binding beta-propeller fold protein YncE